MPKAAYSQEERKRIRRALVSTGLELMARQGVRHTTVEQICKAVGISRTFFYSFFPAKEDLVVEALYFQQPRVLAYARGLMAEPELGWREGVRQFLNACCYGEKNGIAVLTIEEQQTIFHRLSPEKYDIFRQKQHSLFGSLLKCFGVPVNKETIALFTNLSLMIMIVRRAVPDTLPLFVPEAMDSTIRIQIDTLIDWLETLKKTESVFDQ